MSVCHFLFVSVSVDPPEHKLKNGPTFTGNTDQLHTYDEHAVGVASVCHCVSTAELPVLVPKNRLRTCVWAGPRLDMKASNVRTRCCPANLFYGPNKTAAAAVAAQVSFSLGPALSISCWHLLGSWCRSRTRFSAEHQNLDGKAPAPGQWKGGQRGEQRAFILK